MGFPQDRAAPAIGSPPTASLEHPGSPAVLGRPEAQPKGMSGAYVDSAREACYTEISMLTEYASVALDRASYEKLEDGTFCGRIPPCPGVVASARTLSRCQRELREALEGWLIVKLRHGDRIPVIGGIDLNERHPKRLPAHA